MSETLNYLAFLIKEAKNNNQPCPIVFLGAGASKSGGIPLAREIIEDIKIKYKSNPKVCSYFSSNPTPEYPKLMDCLTPHQRNELLKEYISKAKINVAHIYLAQMMVEGYIDYVLTVNFDNLMLRALALYNEFPPTYDMAILKDLTTTTLKEKSVVYLHGQHHGLWLLNTPDELAKVRNEIPKILNSIKDRTWIIVGYSGDDPIFEEIAKLGRFDKDLYWVTYKDNNPSEKVMTKLIKKDNSNTHLIQGFDPDTFMLKLSNALELLQPNIIEKPFSSLNTLLNNIVDIEDDEHFKEVKERLAISQEQVQDAVNQYELGKQPNKKQENEINILKKKLIEIIVNEKYEEAPILELEEQVNIIKDDSLLELFANLHSNWGVTLTDLAKVRNNDEALFLQSFEKYQKAIELNPKNDTAYSNWGNALVDLARAKNNDEALFLQSFEKYQKAIELNPKKDNAYNNWGYALANLARAKNNDEALFLQSFEKYQKAIDINPKEDTAYNNWGAALADLAKAKNNNEALFLESIQKLRKAFELDGEAYNLACIYALTKNKPEALKFLKHSLEYKQIEKEYVQSDEDWKEYLEDIEFKILLSQY